jgi:hypothetical protein
VISALARLTRRGAAGVALLLAATLVGGCSSSGSGQTSDSSAPATPGSSTAPPATSTPSTSKAVARTSAPATPTSAAPPALGAAAVRQIKNAYVTFFDSKTDPVESEKVLQHGDVFKAVLLAQSKTPTAQGLSVTVAKVVPQSAAVAVATFTLISAGQKVLVDTPGYAVREGGTWKVAATTFCGLLKLQSSAPKQCNDAKITAFPSH